MKIVFRTELQSFVKYNIKIPLTFPAQLFHFHSTYLFMFSKIAISSHIPEIFFFAFLYNKGKINGQKEITFFVYAYLDRELKAVRVFNLTFN